jgi:hypothetical protein
MNSTTKRNVTEISISITPRVKHEPRKEFKDSSMGTLNVNFSSPSAGGKAPSPFKTYN